MLCLVLLQLVFTTATVLRSVLIVYVIAGVVISVVLLVPF